MAFDQTLIGNLTAELMEELEARYGETAQIGAVTLIVEVMSEEHGSEISSKFSDPRTHVNLGLLDVARRSLGF